MIVRFHFDMTFGEWKAKYRPVVCKDWQGYFDESDTPQELYEFLGETGELVLLLNNLPQTDRRQIYKQFLQCWLEPYRDQHMDGQRLYNNVLVGWDLTMDNVNGMFMRPRNLRLLLSSTGFSLMSTMQNLSALMPFEEIDLASMRRAIYPVSLTGFVTNGIKDMSYLAHKEHDNGWRDWFTAESFSFKSDES